PDIAVRRRNSPQVFRKTRIQAAEAQAERPVRPCGYRRIMKVIDFKRGPISKILKVQPRLRKLLCEDSASPDIRIILKRNWISVEPVPCRRRQRVRRRAESEKIQDYIFAICNPGASQKSGFRLPAHSQALCNWIEHPLKIHALVDRLRQPRDFRIESEAFLCGQNTRQQ